jgi:hypothetical protein
MISMSITVKVGTYFIRDKISLSVFPQCCGTGAASISMEPRLQPDATRTQLRTLMLNMD